MILFLELKRFLSLFFLVINYNVAHCKDELNTFTISLSCGSNHSYCNKEELEYIAISKLHDQIDDDKNGDIDISESKDFVKESLSNTHGTDKANKFHTSDAHIDKQDLWHIWKSSEVYNWTTADLINWLIVDVELPQYEISFSALKMNGSSLPRLTDNDYLANAVKIENSIHRKKIMIKAVDVVLFGPMKRYQMSNKSVLAIILFFVSVITYLIMENVYSKRFVSTMKAKLNYLSETEKNLSELRNKLKIVENVQSQKDSEIQQMKERHKYEISQAINSSRESLIDDQEKSKSQQEIIKLRSALHEAQIQISQLSKKSASLTGNNDLSKENRMLHLLLQVTHAIESQYLSEKIALVDYQSAEFMELNEKLKKRKSAFLGTFRIIHSSDMDNIEKGFANTKRAYEKIIHEKKDKEHRWNQLESLTGLNLTKNLDISNLRQIIHSESGDLHSKEHSNSSIISSNNEIFDSPTTHSTSESCGNPGSDRFFVNSEFSMHSSIDSTDHDSCGKLEESFQTISPTGNYIKETNLVKRCRKIPIDKKKILSKIGKI